MRRLLISSMVLMFMCALMIQPAFAAISYNSTDDFSTASNPNAPWSYRYAAVGASNSSSSSMSCCFSPDLPAWYVPGTFALIGSDILHTGTSYDPILAFSLPENFNPGTVSLNVDLSDAGTSGDGQLYSIWLNDTNLGNYSLTPSFDPQSISQTIEMGAADSIYLRLNNNGNHDADAVNYNVTISQSEAQTPPVAPEPISSILFLTGAATLGLSYLRKKRTV